MEGHPKANLETVYIALPYENAEDKAELLSSTETTQR